jgi:RNA polymerase primary sigma factor
VNGVCWDDHLTAHQERRQAQRLAAARARLSSAPTTGRRVDAAHRVVAESKQALVRGNLWFIRRLVSRRAETRRVREDCEQAGAVALLRALEWYDWRAGVRLATYAEAGVRKAIAIEAGASRAALKYPSGALAMRHQVSAALAWRDSLWLKHKRARAPTDLRAARAALRERISEAHDALRVHDPDESPEKTAISSIDGARALHAARSITGRDGDMLRRRFGLGGGDEAAWPEVGAVARVSRETARVSVNRSLARLRRIMSSDWPQSVGCVKVVK